jgi:hypothetical protein
MHDVIPSRRSPCLSPLPAMAALVPGVVPVRRRPSTFDRRSTMARLSEVPLATGCATSARLSAGRGSGRKVGALSLPARSWPTLVLSTRLGGIGLESSRSSPYRHRRRSRAGSPAYRLRARSLARTGELVVANRVAAQTLSPGRLLLQPGPSDRGRSRLTNGRTIHGLRPRRPVPDVHGVHAPAQPRVARWSTELVRPPQRVGCRLRGGSSQRRNTDGPLEASRAANTSAGQRSPRITRGR